MFKSSIFSSIYSNICKSKKNDINLNYLNTINKNVNYDKIHGNIIKTFFKREQFDEELYSIFILGEIKLNIVPEILSIDDDNSVIIYNTNNLVSLRSILLTNNLNYIINELFSFLKEIKNYKITIGNLHVDNIYINIKTMEFFIIDLININFDKEENNIDFESLSLSLNSDYFNSISHITTSENNIINNIIDFYM